jgi:hypothetical protein
VFDRLGPGSKLGVVSLAVRLDCVKPCRMVLPSLETALRCGDGRCGTLLASDAEICDECGSDRLVPVAQGIAILTGWAGERPVAYGVKASGATIVGRGSGTSEAPDIDLSRFPRSDSVHRRHAQLELVDGRWRISHLGRNPLVIQRASETFVVEPGTSAALSPGDWLQFGRIRLRLVAPPVGSLDLQG